MFSVIVLITILFFVFVIREIFQIFKLGIEIQDDRKNESFEKGRKMSTEELLVIIKNLEVKKKKLGILAPVLRQYQYVVLSNEIQGFKKALEDVA